MALQVWLPLNRDIRDIGLSSTNPINNGATINNSGIFEKCYEFNSSKTIYITNFNLSSTEFSVSCWVNIVSSIGGGSAEYIVCLNNNNYSGDMQFAIFHRTRTLTIIVNNTEYTVQALDLNAWYHIVLTFANKIAKIYINGTLVNTRTISSNAYTGHNLNVGSRSSANDGSTHAYYANVLVNDVRVYDNVLDDIDIKRLYQKKIFDLVPYSGIKNVLFDRSGFCVKRLINTNAKYYSNSISFSDKNQVIRSKGNGFEFSGGTLSAWFYLKTKPSSTQIFYIDGNNKMSCGLYNNATIFITSSSVSSPAYPADSVIYGSWNHVMITYGTNYAATNLYLNGVKITSNGTNYWTNGNTFLEIGGRAYYEQFFTGRTSCIRVYKDQLTQDDCLKLYNEERNMFLPDEYEELEYIEATGTQWINTNWHPTSDFSVNTKVYINNITSTGESGIFGNYTGGKGIAFGYYNKKIYWGSNTTKGWKNLTQLPITSNTVTIQYNASQTLSSLITSEGSTSSTTILYTFNDTTNPCFIFKPRYSDNGVPFIGKVYYLNIIENNSMVRNFIPAKRKSDNVIGMYDIVSKQFFTNEGSGSFTGA